MPSLRLFAVFTIMSMMMLMFVPAGRIAAQAPAGQGPAGQAPAGRGGGGRGAAAAPFTMTMNFPDGSQLPMENSALGAMKSPEINWTNVPAGAVSFVLDMNDSDFSRNKTTEGMIHWLVWNIPGSEKGLAEGLPMGVLPDGAYQMSASGQTYRAPAGPGRKHHYIFELLALDTKLDVMPGTDPYDTRANVLKAVQGHVLSRSTWVATFGPNDVQVAPIAGGR